MEIKLEFCVSEFFIYRYSLYKQELSRGITKIVDGVTDFYLNSIEMLTVLSVMFLFITLKALILF